MKFAVYKVNLTTCEEKYLGRYDGKKLKTILRGYKETKECSGIYECENSSWIYYIEKIDLFVSINLLKTIDEIIKRVYNRIIEKNKPQQEKRQ